MFPILYLFSDYGLFFLRAALGLILVIHGWPKIKNIRGTAAWMSSAGFWPGMFWAPVVAVFEFFGGLALVSGFFVQFLAAIAAIQFMVIIIWRLIGRQPFASGYEIDILIFVASLTLLTSGGGFYSFG